MGIDMNLVDEQLRGLRQGFDAGRAEVQPADAGAVPARSTSSRLALAGCRRLALMNETDGWVEVGRTVEPELPIMPCDLRVWEN